MTKYEPWRSLLNTLDAPEIVVTFEQLDEVVSLPKQAHMDPNWWSNATTRDRTMQSEAWRQAGYFAQADLQWKVVTFKKIQQQQREIVVANGCDTTSVSLASGSNAEGQIR
jgi:hypothetical protein